MCRSPRRVPAAHNQPRSIAVALILLVLVEAQSALQCRTLLFVLLKLRAAKTLTRVYNIQL